MVKNKYVYYDKLPSFLSSVSPMLRVAAEIEEENRRVAYLCRFCAFENANKLDPASINPGVKEFKLKLLQRLHTDNAASLASRVEKTDSQEIESFYQQYCELYVRALDKAMDQRVASPQLRKANQTIRNLFEVLCRIKWIEKAEFPPETTSAADEVQEKKEISASNNLLPLDSAENLGPIKALEDVRAALSVLRSTDDEKERMVKKMDIYGNNDLPSPLNSITPMLRVAAEIEQERPRAAYLCRLCAFVKAARLDPYMIKPGVKEFNSILLQKLVKDDATSLTSRVKKTDLREIESFYQQYYEHNVRQLDQEEQVVRGAQLGKVYQAVGVLFEVVCRISDMGKDEEVASETALVTNDVLEKKEISASNNLLPLASSKDLHLSRPLEDVRAALAVLRNTHGLHWPRYSQCAEELDLFAWLGAVFGFQIDNIRNMRNYFAWILSNYHARLNPKPEPFDKLQDDGALDAIMNKLFKNYKAWCKLLGQNHNLLVVPYRLPKDWKKIQQRKILYIGLYFLIWGEAAHVRFMPECLRYIFHNMACELHLLSGPARIAFGKNVASYGGGDGAFLRKVITPLYHAVEEGDGNASNLKCCSYDDLNEYFKSSDCFSIGWPIHGDGIRFKLTHDSAQSSTEKSLLKSSSVKCFDLTRWRRS